MVNTNDFRVLLYRKTAREQKHFIENLKSQPPEKIMEAAYEKIIRDDILMLLESDNDFLDDKQVKALLKLDYPLSACYNEWLDSDYSYMDMLRDTIDDFSKDLVKEAEQEKYKRKNMSRKGRL